MVRQLITQTQLIFVVLPKKPYNVLSFSVKWNSRIVPHMTSDSKGENCDFYSGEIWRKWTWKNTETPALWTVFKYLSIQLTECRVLGIMQILWKYPWKYLENYISLTVNTQYNKNLQNWINAKQQDTGSFEMWRHSLDSKLQVWHSFSPPYYT